MQPQKRQWLAPKQAPHLSLRRPQQHADKRLAPVPRAPLGLMPAGLAPLRSHCHTQRRGQPTNWNARRPHGGIRTCLAHRRQQGRSPTVIVLPLPCRPRRLSHGHPRPRRQSRQGSYSRADWRLLPIDQHRPSPRLRRPSRNQQRPAVNGDQYCAPHGNTRHHRRARHPDGQRPTHTVPDALRHRRPAHTNPCDDDRNRHATPDRHQHAASDHAQSTPNHDPCPTPNRHAAPSGHPAPNRHQHPAPDRYATPDEHPTPNRNPNQ
jgi:hypothetical protein